MITAGSRWSIVYDISQVFGSFADGDILEPLETKVGNHAADAH
jgi:hypothetical protein